MRHTVCKLDCSDVAAPVARLRWSEAFEGGGHAVEAPKQVCDKDGGADADGGADDHAAAARFGSIGAEISSKVVQPRAAKSAQRV